MRGSEYHLTFPCPVRVLHRAKTRPQLSLVLSHSLSQTHHQPPHQLRELYSFDCYMYSLTKRLFVSSSHSILMSPLQSLTDWAGLPTVSTASNMPFIYFSCSKRLSVSNLTVIVPGLLNRHRMRDVFRCI